MVTRREFGFLAAGAAGQLLAADKEALVFIGTYTRGGSKGIYSYRFNPSSGKLTEIGVAAEVQKNPDVIKAYLGEDHATGGRRSKGSTAAAAEPAAPAGPAAGSES